MIEQWGTNQGDARTRFQTDNFGQEVQNDFVKFNKQEILGFRFGELCNCWWRAWSALLSLPAFSQAISADSGTVTDQSGGVISGATVTVLDKDRGVSRTLTTDDAGAYNAPT